MFQLIGTVLAVVTLLWVVVTKPAQASLTYGGSLSAGVYSSPPTAGAGLVADDAGFTVPSR